MKFLAVFLLGAATAISQAEDGSTRPGLGFEKIFGGTGYDLGSSVAVDGAGSVYVAGTTTSLDFPIKSGFQQRIGGTPVRASSDLGKTWTSPAIASPVFTVAAASPKLNGVFFAGTSNGIYKSTDTGKNWTALNSGPQYQVNAIVVDASSDPGVVYSAGFDGVLKSQDGGLTWRVSRSQTRSGEDAIILVAHPARPSTLFAGVAIGGAPSDPSLYRSTDAGATWSLLPNSVIGTFALANDPSNPDVLYAGTSPSGFSGGGNEGGAIYKTSDAGDTWTKLVDLPLAINTLAIPASPMAVYAATDNGVMRSRDAGTTWNATSLTAAADTVAVDPNNPQVVYANAGGIFVSTDGGTTWSSVLPVRQYVQTISVVPASPSIVFVGATPGQNIFVSKWSADGTQMLYSTYLGGSYADFPTGLAVDSQGNAYLTGYTFSTDFPVSSSALQTKNAGSYNAFFAKISPDGEKLAYSTYLGGSTGDAGSAIAVDRNGNAYLTGYAGSADFPVTVNSAQPHLRQNCSTPPPPNSMSRANLGDAFVAKINADAAALRYSTYFGGTCADEALGIALDSSGSAYIVGVTTSPDFPTTKGAFQETYRGAANMGFLAKLNPQGTGITYATFLGGPGNDSANAVALDGTGNIYITGSTMGFDQILFGFLYPIPFADFLISNPLPVPGFFIAGSGATYVLKLDSAGSSKEFLQYIGGNFGNGSAIAVDPSGRAWVAGNTNASGISTPASTAFPTVHPFQAKTGQGFVAEISIDGSALLFSSLLDAASSLALDPSGNAFVIGNTRRFVSYKYFYPSALLDRINSTVPSAVTVEEPQRIVPRLGSSFPYEGVVSSEIVVLTGTGLGPDQEVAAQLTEAGTLATFLAGTSVTFDGIPAPLLSVQAERVVCIVPFAIADRYLSTTTIQVQSNNSSSNAILLGAGSTAVEALAVVNEDGSPNSADRPAAPGSVVIVYAAGFGQTVPGSMDGQINGVGTLKISPVGVNIANQDAQILYAGPAPGQVAGITQINFLLPNLTPSQYNAYVGWGPFGRYGDYNAISVYVWQ
jgi:uncharacterized protein (TIGR03437 family)